MKRVGIDVTPLQGPHRMRGIGSTLYNFILHLPKSEEIEYVFFMYNKATVEEFNLLEFIKQTKLTNYTIHYTDHANTHDTAHTIRSLRGIIRLPSKLLKLYADYCFGSMRIGSIKGLDAYVQFDQNQPLPRGRGVKKYVIAYDLIPYILKNDYLRDYSTARKRGHSRKGALRCQFHRFIYIFKVRQTARHAHRVIAISEHTRQDFIKHADVAPHRIVTCHLGVDQQKDDTDPPSHLTQYIPTSWGDLPRKINLPTKDYLLFVGGVDPRRRLVDLLIAFNNLRARGEDIILILTGDTMFGPNTIPSVDVQLYLKQSSYKDDIYFLGFVDDATRNWLYKNALAFIYPSLYEGFGLPILEAMKQGSPVITYRNSSIEEIAEDAAIYASDPLEIMRCVLKLRQDKEKRNFYQHKGINQANKYNWDVTSERIVSILLA